MPAVILPPVIAPLPTFKYPLMFAPVPVTVNMAALPLTPITTLPSVAGIETFEVPLDILLELMLTQVNTPAPSVVRT